MTDRRRDARFGQSWVHAARATLRPGCPVAVVDLSAGGALVQAVRPLRPGARVHMQVATSARTFTVSAHILRCMVWSVDPQQGVVYRGALRFDHRWEFFREGTTPDGSAVPVAGHDDGTGDGQRLPAPGAGIIDRHARGVK